jgi:hypothetical protein
VIKKPKKGKLRKEVLAIAGPRRRRKSKKVKKYK